MTQATFTKTETDADGFGIYNTAELTERGIRLTAWRMDAGAWGWQLTWPNRHELPADASYRTRHEAQRAALAWWQANGADGIDHVRCMHLGERRRFLANTSTRTTKATKATRRSLAEAGRELDDMRQSYEPKPQTITVETTTITVETTKARITVSLDDDRLSMVANLPTERQAHSVLLDYECGTGIPRDRALIHLAGFLHMHGATDAQIAQTLATVDLFDEDDANAETTSYQAGQIAVGLAQARRTNGAENDSPGRGGHIARLVAWHVGITGAPVLA